jgi:DNA-binding MarR family transcriptional regulator
MNKSTIKIAEDKDLSAITTYQAGVMQASTHRQLQKHCDAILKPYGLSKMQWLIIGSILDSGEVGVRVTDLAETLGTTLSYLTNAINLLESRSILMRLSNESDNRSKMVSIDPDFVPKCEEIETVLRAALRKSIYAHVDPQDFRTYMKVLNLLSKVHNPK